MLPPVKWEKVKVMQSSRVLIQTFLKWQVAKKAEIVSLLILAEMGVVKGAPV